MKKKKVVECTNSGRKEHARSLRVTISLWGKTKLMYKEGERESNVLALGWNTRGLNRKDVGNDLYTFPAQFLFGFLKAGVELR